VTSDPAPADKPDGDQPYADPAPRIPMRGQIVRVTGRKAEGGRRGLPALYELVMQNDDGTIMEFGSPTRGEVGSLTGLIEIPAGTFSASAGAEPICPICLEGAATEREHVPQEALDGRRMTKTCERCNNDLRSKVELDLENWFDHALTTVGMDHDGEVPGKRHTSRPSTTGRPGTATSSCCSPLGASPTGLSQMVTSGEFRLHYREPAPDAGGWRC
jgi:hypothetical protein